LQKPSTYFEERQSYRKRNEMHGKKTIPDEYSGGAGLINLSGMSDGGYKIRNKQAAHFVTFDVVEWVDVFTRKA